MTTGSMKRKGADVKSITVELPDRLGEEVQALVNAGWFRDEPEVLCAALREFVQRHRPELAERFQREDIAWALREKQPSP
jgi:Arc/MetJ-type ribon-helix-helix transcriptional regulator